VSHSASRPTFNTAWGWQPEPIRIWTAEEESPRGQPRNHPYLVHWTNVSLAAGTQAPARSRARM